MPSIDINACIFIDKNAKRACYVHPANPQKCIKVMIDGRGDAAMQRHELKTYAHVAAPLARFVPVYDPDLLPTTHGMAVVSDLIRHDDGTIAVDLQKYLRGEHVLTADEWRAVLRAAEDFFATLVKHDLYFYDFNVKNFVVQKTGGNIALKYIDLKSYRRNNAWIKLDMLSASVARRKMMRRIHAFYAVIADYARIYASFDPQWARCFLT